LRAASSHPGVDGFTAEGVFAEITDTGQLCVFDAPSASSNRRRGGCNQVDDPLGGSSLSASLVYEGGPALDGVRDARVFGLAADSVARAQVVMSDGSRRELHLKKAAIGSSEFEAFGYRITQADLKRGVGPVALVALDARGKELARQPTGIG
jgi:hypothetical protein